MKTFILLLLIGWSATAATTYYVNTNDNSIVTALPTIIYLPGATVTGAGLADCARVGWRQVEWWQVASNGWAADSYTNSTATNVFPMASMMIATKHHIATAADGQWTNAPNWLSISNTAHTFSNLVYKYSPNHYTGGLTNFVTTPQTVVSYYSELTRTNAGVTASNSVDFLNATWMLSDIINFAGVSTNFPWRLCP